MSKPEYSFRCKNCNRLVSSEDAGERDTPAACPTCGSGISFDPKTGVKTFDDDNWIKLWELSPEELEAQRVVKKEKDGNEYEYWSKGDLKIVKHVAAPSTVPEGREPQDISREVSESLGAEDRV